MKTLDKTKFAIAAGLTAGIFYLGCVVIMLLTGKEGIITISNALFHGMDFNTIIRTNVSPIESLLGLLGLMVLAGILSYILAYFYNRLS